MVTHYPEACLGWLKVYDSYYKDSGDLDKNAFHLKTSEPGDTFAEVDGKEYKTDDIIPSSGKDSSIALKTHSNDGLILYNIGNNADIPNPTFESSKVYRSKIPVDFSSSPLICIKAVNYVNGKYGNVSTFYFGKGACNITVQNVENGQQKESTSSSV